MRFDECLTFILDLEGPPSNDPNDPGGETVYGVTRRDHPDLFRNGPPSLAVARDLYLREYWLSAGCDKLPAPYDLIVFDGAINQGPVQSVMMLQKAMGLTTDGRIGPQTIAACQTAAKDAPALVLAIRAMRYARSMNFDRYGLGWMRRLFKVSLEI